MFFISENAITTGIASYMGSRYVVSVGDIKVGVFDLNSNNLLEPWMSHLLSYAETKINATVSSEKTYQHQVLSILDMLYRLIWKSQRSKKKYVWVPFLSRNSKTPKAEYSDNMKSANRNNYIQHRT